MHKLMAVEAVKILMTGGTHGRNGKRGGGAIINRPVQGWTVEWMVFVVTAVHCFAKEIWLWAAGKGTEHNTFYINEIN